MLASFLLLVAPGWGQPAPELGALQARAAKGDVEAQNALGNAYTGAQLGLAQDFAEAFKWYRQAGEKGFAPAQFNLGLAYELGRGVAADDRQAFKFYLQSAEQGFAPAQFNVANMYAIGRGTAQDLFEANLWYKQAAENGLVEAQFNLGLVYETGRGVKRDDGIAARWYRQAAERGYARAQYNLGLLLEDGRGVSRDQAGAASLYRAAAEQGFAPAQLNYGLMLAEGREGVARDPIQAYVWLNRAVQNGASPDARDALARTLSPEQMAAARQASGAGSPTTSTPPPPTPVPSAEDAATRLAGMTEALAQARDANSRLAEANQRLELDNARLAGELSQAGNGSGELVSQLREQSRRLADQVQTLSAGKEEAERQNAVLAAQVRDAQRDLTAARTAAPAVAAPGADNARLGKQVADLSARLEEAQRALQQLENTNAELAAANQRLQQGAEKLAAAPGAGGVQGDTEIRRENARLNEEVKRATFELVSLNRQVRTLTEQLKTATPAGAPDGQRLAEVTARAQAAAEEAARMQEENRRLGARLAELGARPQPMEDAAGKLAAARQESAALQAELGRLRAEQADLKKWADSLEQNVNERANAAKAAAQAEGEARRQVAALEAQLRERDAALAGGRQEYERLAAGNKELGERLSRAEEHVRTAASNADASHGQLMEENRRLSGQLAAEQQATVELRAKVGDLERQLAEVRAAGAASGPEIERLRSELAGTGRRADELSAANADLQARLGRATADAGRVEALQGQLAEANQALERSSATVAELTVANQRLDELVKAADARSKDGSHAVQESARLAEALALSRTDLATVRQQAEVLETKLTELTASNRRLEEQLADAESRAKGAVELAQDGARLADTLAATRRDLVLAEERTKSLEAQVAGLQARPVDPAAQVRMDEANRSVEKLETTVAELTAENSRLHQDLDNAEKTAAAALAAQSQAVNAASPDAFRMEISTLQARVKSLETQAEEERASAAREITALATQLQRTRESNRSLTEANRALLAAQESDTSATRDQTTQLEGRVRELTAANEELRRQGQQQAAELRVVAGERDTLRGELTDARKVATVLPGLADEKTALQERLEAVGGQLVQLQREHDELQQSHAELTRQLTASREAGQKADAELAALQARIADAEKADESHTQSVADLTSANERLGQEREDMRRLVESYRADIIRLNQSVRAAEQMRGESERSGQQNIDALTAQLAQLRRDLEAARGAQSRQAESYAAQERERQAIITQLRTENGALAARLNQAQGTLDQIAAAARLGTPAATIAAGGPVPPTAASATSSSPVRYHTVAEGDSLSRISLRYYGTPGRWQEIFQANRDVLQGSNTLRVGQQLRIP